MQKIVEKVILGLILVALVLAVIGLLASEPGLTNAGLIVLMVVAAAYAAVQVIMYVKNDDKEISRQMMWFAIITSVVAVAIICFGVLILTGKVFPNGIFKSVIDTIKYIR
ncbi:MAG: hypothetical protein RR054_02275 [Clostridia bacterium]